MTETQAAQPLGGPAEWHLDDAGGRIPMERWGKDHWTTFLYVETRWVDHRGALDHDHMRCDRARHQVFYLAKRRMVAFGTDHNGAGFATRLKTEEPRPDGTWGVVEQFGHDDYDCIADMIAAGLIEAHMPELDPHGISFLDAWGKPVRAGVGGDRVDPGLITGLVESWLMTAATYTLTERGQTVAGQLRAHMARTRMSHQFLPVPA